MNTIAVCQVEGRTEHVFFIIPETVFDAIDQNQCWVSF
jgi:hypothetical protein